MKLIVISCFIFLCSCSTLSKFWGGAEEPSPEEKAKQLSELSRGHEQFKNGKYEEAKKVYLEFKQKYPQSIYRYSADVGLGQILESNNEWTDAIEVYSNVIESTREFKPEIAALALFRISFAHDALGEDEKSLASLLDAEARSEYLAEEIRLAELPARLSSAYSRVNRDEDSYWYIQKASEGLHQLIQIKKQNLDATWLAQIYFEMGYYSTTNVNLSNYDRAVKSIKSLQTFLIKSMEQAKDPWSEKAFKALKENYKDLWNSILSIPLSKNPDHIVAVKEQREIQERMAGKLSTLIVEVDKYRPMTDAANVGLVKEFYTYVSGMDERVQRFLIEKPELNPLTPDAIQKQNNQIKDGSNVINNEPSKEEEQVLQLPTKEGVSGHDDAQPIDESIKKEENEIQSQPATKDPNL